METFESLMSRGGAAALRAAREGLDIPGIRYVALPTLVELKLASGMSAAHRLKDLADVQELIRVLLGLTQDFARRLNPYVPRNSRNSGPRFKALHPKSV